MFASVHDRSLVIATFRHVCVHLMETLARWTPTTPEMEVKILFGRQIWDFAQMADALGKRAHEMRQPLHFTREPVPAYAQVLVGLRALDATADRVAALGAVQRGLLARVCRYQAQVDDILDHPSIVILASMVRELERQQRDGQELAHALGLDAGSVADDLATREAAIGSLVPESALA